MEESRESRERLRAVAIPGQAQGQDNSVNRHGSTPMEDSAENSGGAERAGTPDLGSSGRRGRLCRICTGCGRCFGGGEGMRIVTDFGAAAGECPPGSRERKNRIAAVDIGTTTVAMVLYDGDDNELDSFVTVNPQTRAGADVLSRIQAAGDPAEAGRMRREVLEVVESGLARFRGTLRSLGDEDGYLVPEVIVAANTTMRYLLMGWDPAELGSAPFHSSHQETVYTRICGMRTVILPGFSAFVGGDILAGIHACGMAETDEITLLVDLGTNGEMALGNREGITACATAAGPAFEGGASKGIWGADMVRFTAELLREGILDETGLMSDEFFDTGIRIGNVLVTQQAVRGLQLAKGAIAAGIETLIGQHGLRSAEQIGRVVLAGGFGYYLRAEDAAAIGLIPSSLRTKVTAGGNTALAGALRFGRSIGYSVRHDEVPDAGNAQTAEMDREPEKQEPVTEAAEHIRKITRVINLAETEGFSDLYLESMNLETC